MSIYVKQFFALLLPSDHRRKRKNLKTRECLWQGPFRHLVSWSVIREVFSAPRGQKQNPM